VATVEAVAAVEAVVATAIVVAGKQFAHRSTWEGSSCETITHQPSLLIEPLKCSEAMPTTPEVIDMKVKAPPMIAKIDVT